MYEDDHTLWGHSMLLQIVDDKVNADALSGHEETVSESW